MQQTATTPLLLRPLLSLSPLLPLSMPPPPLALVKRSANWRLWTDRGRGLLVWKRLAFLILSPFVRLFVKTQNAQNLPCFLLLFPSCCHWKSIMLLPLFPFSSDSLKNKMFLKVHCNNKQPLVDGLKWRVQSRSMKDICTFRCGSVYLLKREFDRLLFQLGPNLEKSLFVSLFNSSVGRKLVLYKMLCVPNMDNQGKKWLQSWAIWIKSLLFPKWIMASTVVELSSLCFFLCMCVVDLLWIA